jgi:type VI secretion system protein ImpM
MSRLAPQQTRIGYFGKLPVYGDFVKASDNVALVHLLDDWLAGVMNLLTAEARWKQHYDALPALRFAFVGTRSKQAIAGHIAASHDQSQRRFPFLSMSAIAVGDAAGFAALSPLVLDQLWATQQALAAAVLATPEPAAALQALAATVVPVAPADPEHAAAYAAFLQRQTLDGLEGELAEGGCGTPLRRLLLALGLVLRPMLARAGEPVVRALRLPLPRAPQQRALVASFWLHLVMPFLRRDEVELALFFTDEPQGAALTIGFAGAEPDTLRALIDHDVGAASLIGFEQLTWLDARTETEAGVPQLVACLAQPKLGLDAAQQLFHRMLI